MRRRRAALPYETGVRLVPYDLVKEIAVAMVVTLVLTIVLAAALSSPDVPSVTLQSWARSDPVDFVTTAASELSASSTSAQYGPPYNDGDNALQRWAFLQPQKWAGVHQPVDSASAFILMPLQLTAGNSGSQHDALAAYQAASADQQSTWLDTYTKALDNATEKDGAVVVASGDYGPVQTLMDSMLGLARSGALDGLLLASGAFYQTDYTQPLLFMGDGGYLSGLAQDQNLTGSQWGMMNETGRYPGQAWLWLYTMWYQVAPFNRDADTGFLGISGANADLGVVGVMGILTLLLLFLPFIPGLRDIPRLVPVHRLIWRRYYAEERRR